jgi:hypothetical protein
MGLQIDEENARPLVNAQFAVISASAAGDNTIVAGPAGKKIRVLTYHLVAAAAVTLTWKSGATAISGPMPLAPPGVLAVPFAITGVLKTLNAADALVLNLGAAVAVGGVLTYVLVP